MNRKINCLTNNSGLNHTEQSSQTIFIVDASYQIQGRQWTTIHVKYFLYVSTVDLYDHQTYILEVYKQPLKIKNIEQILARKI